MCIRDRDEFLDGVFDKFGDSGDLLTALVLSASPTEVKLARSSREIITVTDKKVLGVVDVYKRQPVDRAPLQRRTADRLHLYRRRVRIR